MRMLKLERYFLTFLFVTAAVAVAANSTVLAQSPPNINVNGYVVGDSVRRGGTAKAVVEMDIPGGFHVHSNRSLEKFLIATQLKVEAPAGLRVSAVPDRLLFSLPRMVPIPRLLANAPG